MPRCDKKRKMKKQKQKILQKIKKQKTFGNNRETFNKRFLFWMYMCFCVCVCIWHTWVCMYFSYVCKYAWGDSDVSFHFIHYIFVGCLVDGWMYSFGLFFLFFFLFFFSSLLLFTYIVSIEVITFRSCLCFRVLFSFWGFVYFFFIFFF